MVRIKKTPSERHTATISPAITSFVQEATSTPLHQLPTKLVSFPRLWPLPRGDLYHWIQLLDRFDHILELFNKEYALNEGPQTQPFKCRLLEKGDEEEGMPYPAKGAQKQELDALGFSGEGDRELVESVVYFTRLLLEHCGNRSLYASSGHVNDLLHTTSLSLLKAALKLGLRLAQRYQVARYKNNSASMQPTLLANHYNFNLDNLHKIALPFPKPPSSLSNVATTTPGKGKDKAGTASAFNPSDLSALVKEPLSGTLKRDLSNVNVTYYDQPAAPTKPHTSHPVHTEAIQTSPTPVRRTSALGPSRDHPTAGDHIQSSNDISDTPVKSLEADTSNAPKTFQVPASQVAETPSWQIVRDALSNVPKDSQYDLLNRIRVAQVFAWSQPPIHLLLETRLLAIANLAYAVGESKFQEKIGQADGEEPRRFHLAQQLCDLLQPVANGESVLSLDLEITVLQTLEALVRLKHKWSEVVEALAITVNHGILYYELRKAVATLHAEDHADTELELKETEWRTATLLLVDTVSQVNPQAKYAERMLAAGVMDIEIEVLTLRTKRAERHQEKVIGFLDAYIHNITTSFQTLTSLKGLDILSDLAKYEVDASLASLERGQGMPAGYKSKVIDYDIPYYQQATLRMLFRFIVHLFDHNSGVHDRELRNLLDSPQMLGALRTVIASAKVFGSNVWSGAVNTVSNFIHNEPTSYQVVAEAGLAKGILETITRSTLPEEVPVDFEPKVSYEPEPVEVVNGEVRHPAVEGILPVGETICDIPTAFGAICLNENGMKLFQLSNALDKFFDIFVSPAHVRALEDEGMAAASVGNAFDELARHHPQLKDQILAAIIKMVKKVRSVTLAIAEQSGTGGKLWKLPSGNDDAEVAGGLRAVAGHGVFDASARVTAAEIKEEAAERANATPYISACVKFLEGFFHNATMCQSFCVNGGAEIVIDLATSPSNPPDLVAYSVFSKMATVVKRMCEEKPHLVLPILLARTQLAIKNLRPLIDSTESGSYFKQFTDIKLAGSTAVSAEGTTVIKSLTSIHVLSHMLGRAVVPSHSSPRHASVNQVFTMLNFTDVYVELIDALAKLHSSCLWENLSLKEQFSEDEKWRNGTDPKPFSPRRINAQGFVELPQSNNTGDNKNDSDPKGLSAAEIGETKAEVFAFKNTRAIRYLISQTPTGIESFFQNLGQVLIPKRTTDLNTKQHAGLVADHLAKSALSELDARKLSHTDEASELKYVSHVLHCMTRMMLKTSHNIDSMGGKEAVTLVLLKFYFAGGFEKLQNNLTWFSNVLERPEEKSEAVETAARDGMSTILSFYSQIVRTKCINDAAQSSLLSVRGPDNADFFAPGQFLVEIRKVVLDTVTVLWHSDAIVKMGEHNVKAIIETLKFILKADGEERAIHRSEGATRRVATTQPDFTLKNFSNVDKVKNAGFEGDLAREALYRCNNHEFNATEYAALRKNHSAPRFKIPGGDKEKETESSQSIEMRDAGAASSADPSAAISSSQEVPSSDQDMSEDDNFGSLGALPDDMASSDLRAMAGERTQALRDILRMGEGASAEPPAEDTKRPFMTVEDLSETRDQVRADIIDRCLEVLSAQPSITFELSDLIHSAVAKSGEGANPRAEIGNTLVSSLLSLQGEEGPDSGAKISSYAHLVALIMQERDFFDSTLDELKDNFDSFINWIQLRPDQKAEDAPWIEMLLLIMERVLAEDEQPVEVEWSAPSIEDPLKPLPEPKAVEPVVPTETREQLFSTIVDILPKVGKNPSLALSITRVLVILTRRRDLASRLSDKMCMSRLFLMIRQLAGAVGEKLQSSFLLVLRHLVEDEQTIRQIMKTEIKNAFEGQRSMRAIDTTTYVRNMYHLVLRDPKMFVEVTQEMLEISRFDGHPNRAQTLALKQAPKPEETSQDAGEAKAETEGPSDQQTKSMEPKAPTTDSSDGVVPFLLRELSSFREVEEKPVAKKQQESKTASAGDKATASGDVDMPDVATDEKASEVKKEEKPVFKAEEHTIYIYRCFLLQCLSEILACYSRTKLEFINFSRKTESQPNTPSKPRSGTLMYLLNVLLPTGSLEHKDDIAHRKKQVTSNWATTVLVALCSQTQEKHQSRSASANQEEDTDLLFVRRFVLDHALKVYKDATVSPEPLDQRYSKLLAVADLFDRMLNAKPDRQSPINASGFDKSRKQLGRLMYEKNLIAALTSSVAELDLNFPNAKRAVKHILVPLKTLTDLAVDLSQNSELSSVPGTSTDEDDIASDTSASEGDSDEEREQTPDLYRNSALGIYNAEEDDDDDEEDDEDDEEMEDYEGYDEEMEFEEGDDAAPGDVVSDDDDEDDLEGMEDEMGPIEGMHGDRMEVEVIDESDDDDDDESGDEVDDDDDEEGFSEHDLEEVTGDEENASLADDMEEADWEDEADDYDDEEDAARHGGPLDHIAQVLGDPSDGADQDGVLQVDMGGEDGDEFFEDEMPPGDDEDDDEEDEIDYDGDVVYEPEQEDEEMDQMGWEWDVPPPAIGRAHHHHHRHGGQGGLNEFLDFMNADPLRPAPSRYHRGPGNSRGEEEGTNPLLQRNRGTSIGDRAGGATPPFPSRSGRLGGGHNIIGDLVAAMNRPGGGDLERISLNVDPRQIIGGRGGMPPVFAISQGGGVPRFVDIDPRRPWREQIPGFGPTNSRGGATTEEGQAVDFKPMITSVRWQEEARMLFAGKHHEKATRIIHSLLRLLLPPAMESKKVRDKEEAERRAAEEKAREEERKKAEAERKEREEREKKEREEKEAKEAEEAAARDREAAAEAATHAPEGTQTTSMEGVEQDATAASGEAPTEQAPPRERVTITIRGRELDITELGIDREYIEALPEEFREDVIMGQFAERRAAERAEARQTGEAPSEISREFLDALPPEIQAELLASEARDRRQREQTEARRQSRAQGGPAAAAAAQPQDMDQVDFLATLDPGLRQTVLMEQDPDMLNLLPEELQREARELIGDRPRHRAHRERGPRVINVPAAGGQPAGEEETEERQRPRPVVQMLDKPGVATLLRLMFVSLHHRAKTSLHCILSDVCKNNQNRAEVISILLSILQDGTADVGAVERSFAQLSLRAKQLAGAKTPQPLKRTLTGQMVTPATELSPLNIVQQCLGTLGALSADNPKVQTFFLSEHETITSQKTKAAKKNKGKESKASKYPLNALMMLLDRKLITENTGVMETLAGLLSRVTHPLHLLTKKKESEAKKEAEKQQSEETKDETAGDVAMQEASTESAGGPSAAAAAVSTATEKAPEGDRKEVKPEPKKKRELEPPEVPEENIRLVINILALRECPSKTFSDTLDIIKHLCAIPGAKEIFGKELIRQAQELGQSIVVDLEDLAGQIGTAKTGVDLQGMALAKFSSSGSQQRRLLQVLIALDHLFDPKRAMGVTTPPTGTVDPQLKEDILTTLSESDTFEKLWKNLSLCLGAIRQRGNMVNVATILLPLIETLFVVCRNSALKESGSAAVEVTPGTPQPEKGMESLFYTFTEEHRKILNELIRNNPKLMNGNLSILAKNSKVLEFDNKRNYFNRKLHTRADRTQPHGNSLQLPVRRDHVFLDSYKVLYYKSGEEIKNGKLNVRFNGEEGIDAGGVTREWFAAMARQMFNPDYALFNPVASDRTTFHPNKLSGINDEHLSFFKFIGRVIGKALYEGRLLDAHFSRAVYRRMLGKSVSLKDMETLDLDYYRSLVWILENDITDVTFETFSAEVEAFGVTETVDLIPGGRDIAVTEDNKQEYVRLVVEHKLIKSVEAQLDAFLGGFHDIIPEELVAIFNEQELELLISGLPDIDVDDWKNTTEYHNYTSTSPQIQWFWRAVKSFDEEERAKLLQFVTGTSKVPLNGFKELEGMNGFAKFNIHRDYSSKDKLPTSHTCFNQLDLPEYESYETLRQQLYTAVTAGNEYFGFA